MHWFNSLKAKSFLFLSLLIACISVACLGLSTFAIYTFMYEELDKRGFAETGALALESRYGLISQNPRLLQQIAARALGRPDINAVEIRNHRFQTVSKEVIHSNSACTADRVLDSHQSYKTVLGDLHCYFRPVYAEARNNLKAREDEIFLYQAPTKDPTSEQLFLGQVIVSLSEQSINERFKQLVLLALSIAVAVAVAALLVSYFFLKRALQPLSVMATNTRKIAAGELQNISYVQTHATDEIGVLGEAFNSMVEQLQQYRDAVDQRSKQLVHARKSAEKASRAKSDFLAHMSHELRTPLNSIIGFAELLAKRVAGEMNTKQIRFVDNIARSGDHLLALVNDLLDLTKIEAGKEELKISRFDLNATIDDTIAQLAPQLAYKKLGFRRHSTDTVEAGISHIEGDQKKVAQILMNLLSNAIKFTPEGGDISLTTELKTTYGIKGVSLHVQDNGVGISPANQRKIFEQFEQIRAKDHHHLGSGLGLSLAKKLVEMHYGTISVHSEGLAGKGSCFSVWLPCRSAVGSPSV